MARSPAAAAAAMAAVCWCRMKRRPSVGWMDFAADRRGIGRTGRGERERERAEGLRALAPYKSCWHYYVRPGLNLSRDRKLDTASPVILIYRKCNGGLGRRRHHRARCVRAAFCIFAAIRDVTRFFRLIENYGFTGERRCVNPLARALSFARSKRIRNFYMKTS